MTLHALQSIEVSRVVRATPPVVFEAWTTPAHLSRWSCPVGATVEEADVDLTIGGAYRIRMRGAEGEGYTVVGRYREVDPPFRLVYTWDWEETANQVGETLVTVRFEAVDDLSTRVTVVHSGLPTPDAARGHETGWTSCLDRLEALVGTA